MRAEKPIVSQPEKPPEREKQPETITLKPPTAVDRFVEAYNSMAECYSWPVAQRWMLGVSGLVTNEMLDDDERTMTLRLDSLWSLGIGAEWQWTDRRRVQFAVSYFGMGDGPVRTAEIPGVGALEGEFKSRDTFLFQVSVDLGAL